MPELQPIDVQKARALCGDNYDKGADYFHKGAVSDAWRTASALHAAVAGSAKTPYTVSLALAEDGQYKASCTCPAARRPGLCKHAAALLVAWAEKPQSFRRAAETEPVAEGTPKVESEAKRLRQPKADRRTLVEAGLDRVEGLLVELCTQGLLSLTKEQVEMIGGLAEATEAHRLRRLARQVMEIQRLAARAQEGGRAGFDDLAWGRLLGDTWFVLSATRKALEKEDESNRAEVEDLIGKTWLEKDLRRLADLHLVEMAYQTEHLESGFRLETSYLLDLNDGATYAEKQITPLKLKDIPPKRSYSASLRVREAGVYPGFPPLRVKLIDLVEEPALGDIWDRVVELAPLSATAVRQQLQQATANPVAPPEAYTLFRPDSVVADGDRLILVGAEGKGIAVGGPRTALWAMRGAIARGPLGALFCRLWFAEEGMLAEPLSVIRGEAGDNRLVRLTA